MHYETQTVGVWRRTKIDTTRAPRLHSQSSYVECNRYQKESFWRTFFMGTSSSNGLIFHMWEEKGLKFDLALKETEFFVYALNREERRITLIPKTIGNRKRLCVRWLGVINLTWENLQIAKHKSGRRSFSGLICALRSVDFLRWGLSPRATSRTISFSISNTGFWY